MCVYGNSIYVNHNIFFVTPSTLTLKAYIFTIYLHRLKNLDVKNSRSCDTKNFNIYELLKRMNISKGNINLVEGELFLSGGNYKE